MKPVIGKPVNFVSKSDNEEAVACIDKNTAHWDKEHNINLRKQSEIYGESYELNYVSTEGEFCATCLTPLECFVLEDGTAQRTVVLALHRFKRKFENAEYLDVYTDAEILHFEVSGDTLKSKGSHPHLFERVPVIVCPANTDRKSGFSDVLSLFDAYNAINSDLVNEIADHRNAYLVIENAKIEEEDLLSMKKMGIIQVPKGGKVSWLIKDINDSFVQNELNNIERKIYDMMDEVNFNENWAANTSALALRNKLLNLENRVSMRQAFMESVILQRLRNLFLFIRKKENRLFDYRDIAVKFTRNLPTDLVGLADEIKKRYPDKDPKDIELESLKNEIGKMQTEKQRESLINQAMRLAGEKGLPLNLVSFFVGENEEARLKTEGYVPPNHSGESKTLEDMNMDEYMSFRRQDKFNQKNGGNA